MNNLILILFCSILLAAPTCAQVHVPPGSQGTQEAPTASPTPMSPPPQILNFDRVLSVTNHLALLCLRDGTLDRECLHHALLCVDKLEREFIGGFKGSIVKIQQCTEEMNP